MGGKSSQSTQQIQIPPEVLARYNAVNARAETVAERPYQQYSTDPNAFVAPLTPTQQAGIANTNYYANTAQPYYQAATGLTMAGAQAVNPGELGAQQINQYMSPYLGNVLQGTAALQNQLNQQAMAGQTGNAIRQGAFGGDRAGIAAANLAQQQQLASSKTFADILNQGYNQALGTAQQQQALGLSAAQANRAALQGVGSQIANLGLGAQSAGLQGAQAQLAAGQAAQQTEQAGKTALYNQFLQGQSYPFQVAQFLANIAMGTGALSGSTTQTNQAMGGFSDKRLKENIKPVGKTFDGQTIYSYNFKGEPQTEIGLIAQEVEKHHPEAVGLAGGYKTVRYDKATDDAANRGHFAAGGSAMGGGVMPMNAGQGYFDGGAVGFDPGLMQQILSTYERMYAPLEGQKGGLGAASYVPESNLPVGQIMAPGALPDMPNPSAGMQGMVDLGTGVGGLGGNLGLWDYTDEQRKETRRKEEERLQGLAPSAANTISENPEFFARGGLAAARHAYATDGSVNADDEIVVEGRREQKPEPEIRKVEVPVEKPAPVQIAPVSKPATNISQKPDFKPMGLNIPQVGNTVGLAVAPGLDSLKDSTGDILSGIGKVASAAAAFSDRRLKENVRAVGKTFDGQTVYSYNYKGEPQTRMGLIAQEVEKHHPHAVGSREGYKTVNYKQATGVAARRGHFAEGGDVGENDNQPAGIDIPMVNNATGLTGAPGLSSLQNNLGDVLKGVGSMAEAGKDIFDKAEGGALSGLGALEFKHEGLEPDFGLDPEDLTSSGDEDFEYLMRGLNKGEEQQEKPAGLAPKEDAFVKEMQRRKMADQDWYKGLASNRDLAQGTPSAPMTSDLSKIAQMIRGHEGMGKNPRSSALGPYQMIDSTFVNYFRKMYPEQARGKSNSEILSIRRSPAGIAVSEQIGPQIIRDNAKTLASRGFEPNARNIYLAHFFGPETATKVLSANPVTPIERIVGQEAVNANPFLRGRDAMGAIRFAEDAMAKQQRLLGIPGKAEGGVAGGRRGYALDGEVITPTFEEDPDDTFYKQKNSGLAAASAPAPAAAAAPAQPPENVDTRTIEVMGSRKPAMPEGQALVAKDVSLAAPVNVDIKKRKPPIDEEISNIPGYNTDYFRTPFFKGLGRGSAQSWIPLLTGLGTFATTPTRSALSGLLAGVGAGAQSYANIATERNRQLPTRQAAMAQMVNAARQTLPQVLTLSSDGVNYIYKSANGPYTVTPAMAATLRNQILYSGRGELPPPPEGSKPYEYAPTKPKDYTYKALSSPEMTSVAGIVSYAHQDPTVAQAFSARQQAADAMSDARRLIDSDYAAPEDIQRGQAKLDAAGKQYEAADQRYTSARNAIMQPLLQNLGTSVEKVGAYNIGVLADREQARAAFIPIEPILQKFRENNYAGGVSANFWNNLTSLAKQLGAPPEVIGDGQTAAQQNAALAKLLEGTGVSADALSIGQDPVATKAVVEAIQSRINDAQARYDAVKKQAGTPTATPTAAGNAGTRAPAPRPKPMAPASAAPVAGVKQISPGVWGARTLAELQADSRVKNGDSIIYRDENGATRRGVMTGK